jgi:hypothetical protein
LPEHSQVFFLKLLFSLTCSRIWLNPSCGELAVHLPHEIEKKKTLDVKFVEVIMNNQVKAQQESSSNHEPKSRTVIEQQKNSFRFCFCIALWNF